MTCSAAIIRRYQDPRTGSGIAGLAGLPTHPGGAAERPMADTSAATMAASGSGSGCRPRRAPHLSESISRRNRTFQTRMTTRPHSGAHKRLS
jgi:hypothetical protein